MKYEIILNRNSYSRNKLADKEKIPLLEQLADENKEVPKHLITVLILFLPVYRLYLFFSNEHSIYLFLTK